MYMPFLFFFSSSSAPQLSTQNLKASLSRTLDIFYPLAGRFAALPNGALQLECSNKGIEFIEAFVDANLDDFGGFQQHDPRYGLLDPCEWPAVTTKDITTLPLVVVQVTRFQCGGSALLLAVHHSVGDGYSASLFLKAWSLVSRGRDDAVILPRFQRSLMHMDARELKVDPAKLFTHLEYRVKSPGFIVPATFSGFKICLFTFTTREIDALKSFCGFPATKFEAVTAHIWKFVTKARNLDPSDETKLGIPVDGRQRFLPPLPETYFGNVLFQTCAASSSQKIVASPLSYAARLVHEATHRITDEYMRSAVHWLDQQPNLSEVSVSFSNVTTTDLVVTSWLRFPHYECDFGGGKPVFAGTPMQFIPGAVIILPSKDNGTTISALIGLKTEDIQNLVNDPEFMKFVQYSGK